MHVITTDSAARLAGAEISQTIAEHIGDIVCLLSGGSALNVIEHINEPANNHECRTIFMMGDERGSRDPQINNSLQLLQRYPDHYVAKNFISTVPEEGEALGEFSKRIETIFTTKLVNLQKPKIIYLLGVGPDGHTAGIFPLPKETFADVYDRDLSIVPAHCKGLKIDSRASLTPSWILNNVDELIVYAGGKNKKQILESLINETKALYERPAELIKQHAHSTVYTDQPIEQT